ncbi:extracellular solute-binding protein [Conexibacter stalactiti]|uniref:Extracellular solute-binding protein n=1 Tax=Conexibacter stalactiti TaxID=1940611 RepID=A0ABU4HRA5_9ACTN|nr:extracellular solute-binding protein [Conexibacter stalactiti]MDW5595734.1 extracellular solute-binding protein [Conexibacter stalactiti]MEC5036376.1 extracellular solute-binding protein [Conexibacter stalactiti]
MRAAHILPLAAVAVAVAVAGCGSSSGTTAVATAPRADGRPQTGTLRIFSYDDTIAPEMLARFKRANPGLEVKTATFESNQEAAAKLAGGFEADVVEVCLDEMQPLVRRNLLRPLDTAGISTWDDIVPSLREAPGVVQDGRAYVAPLSAGPAGLVYNSDDLPEGIDSYADLFDPALKGRVALDSGDTLAALAVAALAQGYDNPMALSDEEVARVGQQLADQREQFRAFPTSDADLVNLMKTGEVVAMNAGRGSAQEMLDEGIPVRWVAPREGVISWVCGFAITSKAKNIPAAYALIEDYLSPATQAVSAAQGFVITNEKALPKVAARDRETADPRSLEHAIAETEPENVAAYERAFQRIQAGG